MLQVGIKAPDFETMTSDGNPISLSAYRGKKVILFFFPKAFTSGCTVETRLLRDRYDELNQMGAEVIGISTDNTDTQCAFATKEKVTFPMIADPTKEISRKYDVVRPILNMNKRITYIIDELGVIRAAFHDEIFIQRHVEKIQNYIQNMKGGDK